MNKLTRIWTLAAALLLPSFAVAHPATERFIPIGQSPGMSGKHTWIGEVISVDADLGFMRMRAASGEYQVRVDQRTRIYLDRSSQRLTNIEGKLRDCRPGHRVEVKYGDNPSAPVEWVKVESSGG